MGKYLFKVNNKDTRRKTVECHFKRKDTNLKVNVFIIAFGQVTTGNFKKKKLSGKEVFRSHDFQQNSRTFADTKYFWSI